MPEVKIFRVHRYYRWLMWASPIIMVSPFLFLYFRDGAYPYAIIPICAVYLTNVFRGFSRVEFSGKRVSFFNIYGFRRAFDSDFSEISKIRMGYVNGKCQWFKLYGTSDNVLIRRSEWPDFDTILGVILGYEHITRVKTEGYPDFNYFSSEDEIGNRPVLVMFFTLIVLLVATFLSSLIEFDYIYAGDVFWLYLICFPVGWLAAFLFIRASKKAHALAASTVVSVLLCPALVYLGLQVGRLLVEDGVERVSQEFVLAAIETKYQIWEPKKPLIINLPADLHVKTYRFEDGYKPGGYVGDVQIFKVVIGAFGGIGVRPILESKTVSAKVEHIQKPARHLFDKPLNSPDP